MTAQGKTTNILVSNDDGVQSEGILALARELKALGEVTIIAPELARNASSQSLTLHKPLRMHKIRERVYASSGTPADCINMGIHHLMKERLPDLIVSGINKGQNLGEDVLYSGTVSAAIEGYMNKVPSFSISLAGVGNYQFQVAAEFARRLSEMILDRGLPKDTLLNVNVPNLPKEKIQGAVFVPLGRRFYHDVVQEREDPKGRKYYWISGNLRVLDSSDYTDYRAIEDGKISVTPIKLDLTDRGAMDALKKWEDTLS